MIHPSLFSIPFCERLTLTLGHFLWQGWREPTRFRLGLELTKDHTAEVLAEQTIPKEAERLTHVDDSSEGERSLAASGQAVQFARTGDATFIEAVQIFASRYGYPKPPDEDFHVYLLNEQHQVLAGTVAKGFRELSDRQWMIRACFSVRQ